MLILDLFHIAEIISKGKILKKGYPEKLNIVENEYIKGGLF